MSSTTNAPSGSNRVRIVVATSVMLTFISYWRAAAVILNDLGSSAFYAGGIAEQAVGKSAPWFVLAVMLFAFAARGHACQTQRFRADVRLHTHRSGLRRFSRTIHRRPDQRNHHHRRRARVDPRGRSSPLPWHSAGRSQHHVGDFCRRRHGLFLVGEHQGHRGIERESPLGDAGRP